VGPSSIEIAYERRGNSSDPVLLLIMGGTRNWSTGRKGSLTSMMSTTGSVTVGQPHPETLRSVFGGPPATTRLAARRP